MLGKLFNSQNAKLSVSLGKDVAICYLCDLKTPEQSIAEFSIPPELFANPNPLNEWLPKDYNLREIEITLLPSVYSTGILDVPAAVQNDKILKKAIYWQIKDKVQLPEKELIIDYIDLPDKTSKSEGKKNVLAFYVNKAVFASILKFVESDDVLLQTVHAAPMVYKKLMDLTDTQTAFVIDCSDEQSQLNVFRGQELLFSRSVGFDEAVLLSDDPQDIYTVNMEILRSKDFLARHFTKTPAVTKIFILSKRDETEKQLEHLSQELELPCVNLNVDQDPYFLAKQAVQANS